MCSSLSLTRSVVFSWDHTHQVFLVFQPSQAPQLLLGFPASLVTNSLFAVLQTLQRLYCCSMSKTFIITYVYLVSAPDPHVTPARKRVWYLTSDFLVVLTLSHECQVELRNSCSHADSPQPRKRTLDTRPSFVRESREGLGPRLTYTICMGQWVSVLLVCVPKAKAFLCTLVCVSSFVAV